MDKVFERQKGKLYKAITFADGNFQILFQIGNTKFVIFNKEVTAYMNIVF